MKENTILKIEINNNHPVELIDLTKSLYCLGEQYKRYCMKHADQSLTEDFKLFIKEIKTGSIKADLIALAPLTLEIVRDIDTVKEYASYLKYSFDYFLGKSNKKYEYEKPDYIALSGILDPVAKDSGSQFNINAANSNNTIVVANNITFIEANAAQNAINKEQKELERLKENIHEKALLYLVQTKKDTASQTGDRGIIEEISPRTVKIIFESEEIKKAIIHAQKNPYHYAYVVDVKVQTVQSIPTVYKVISYHESVEIEKQ